MHVVDAYKHAVAGIEVVTQPTTYHYGKRKISSLCPVDAIGTFRVDKSSAPDQFEVWDGFPISLDKIAPDAQIESPVSCFWSFRDRGKRPRKREFVITTKNGRAPYIAHLPSE